ncbi:transposase [Paenibacillus sp.]|uniref:transposase n=1 Tax=Paenibacillus sp. TaxID=58172 RepID=UPI0028B04AE8|nr:transposase [Paenibacillus sp.]
MGEQRQRYDEKFRRETVKYLLEQTKSVEDISLELNIPAKTLHGWKAKYRELKNEPIATLERVRELEQLIAEQKREIQMRDKRIADVEEEPLFVGTPL